MESQGAPVELKVYDLSRGVVQSLSRQLLGYALEGVWHTSLFVFGKEFFYGGGVQEQDPTEFETTNHIVPAKRIPLGNTQKSLKEFREFLTEISPKFTEATYDLIKWNCNHFTDTCMTFLLNQPLHKEYINQHECLMGSPVGNLIIQMLQGMNLQNPIGPGANRGKPSNEAHVADISLSKQISQLCESLSQANRRPVLNYVKRLINQLEMLETTSDKRGITLDDTDPHYMSFMSYTKSKGEQLLSSLGFERFTGDDTSSTNCEKHLFRFVSLKEQIAQELPELKKLIERLLEVDEKESPAASAALKSDEVSESNKCPKYAVQLEKLKAMGFNDLEAAIRALQDAGGNIYDALDRLTS